MQLSVRGTNYTELLVGRATCAAATAGIVRRRARVDSDSNHRQHGRQQPYTTRKQLIDQWCAAPGSPTKVGLSEVAFATFCPG
eukprot:2700141-Prymnesium_polylepis.1